jgi:hypothetical protein
MNELFKQYGLTKEQELRVVVRSNVKPADAMGRSAVPEEVRDLQEQMRPYIVMMDVLHRDYDDGISQGQLVVHRGLVDDMNYLFTEMFKMRFPIFSVIPQSVFGYVDENSMQRNNSSCWRPEWQVFGQILSEHTLALAVDINTKDNRYEKVGDNGELIIQPAGAIYDPSAKGALVGTGEVVQLWRDRNFNWAGYWSNRAAREYVRPGLRDLQHFELTPARRAEFYDDLPPGLRDM